MSDHAIPASGPHAVPKSDPRPDESLYSRDLRLATEALHDRKLGKDPLEAETRLLEEVRAELNEVAGKPSVDQGHALRWKLDRAAMLRATGQDHYQWRTIPLGLGDWSVRVDHSKREVAKEVLAELATLREEIAAATFESPGRWLEQKAEFEARHEYLKLKYEVLDTEHRYDRKREGGANKGANVLLDKFAKGNVPLDKRDPKVKGHKVAFECATAAKVSLVAARAGFERVTEAGWGKAQASAIAEVRQHLARATQEMDWYDSLRGNFVEDWAATFGAYVPSTLLAEPFFRKMGEKRWDQSTHIKDLLNLLSYKEIFNMAARFLVMGRDYSVTDPETVSAALVEIVAGAAVTGAVVFGSSMKVFKTNSQLLKTAIDAGWGAVAGYFGGVVTWAAVNKDARGGQSLHQCGLRAVKNCMIRYGLGHFIVSGGDFIQRLLWGAKQPPEEVKPTDFTFPHRMPTPVGM